MQTVDRMFFAVLIAAAAAWIFSALWSEWRRRRLVARLPAHARGERQELEEVCRGVAAGMEGCVLVGPSQFRLLRRGIHGRCDLISDKTEIHLETGELIRQVVEVVPAGFWVPGPDRFRARGSREEYGRLFKHSADEAILLDIGAPFELRLSPEGMTLRIHALPTSTAALGHWITCAFRILDLVPGVDVLGRVEVTDVRNHVGDDASCQVCGASLAGGPVVRCEKCRTPHHEDCWNYAKKCSTFGCAGERCVP